MFALIYRTSLLNNITNTIYTEGLKKNLTVH